MRVAIAGFMHESKTFNPLRTDRAALGRHFPVVISLDLPGNLSQRLIDHCDAAVAYRTYPHIDQRECGRRAAALLARMLRKEVRPRTALAKPPAVVNILAQESS